MHPTETHHDPRTDLQRTSRDAADRRRWAWPRSCSWQLAAWERCVPVLGLITDSVDAIPFLSDAFGSDIDLVAGVLRFGTRLLAVALAISAAMRSSFCCTDLYRASAFMASSSRRAERLSALPESPFLRYAIWAATPGTHASPFEWSMTLPTWQNVARDHRALPRRCPLSASTRRPGSARGWRRWSPWLRSCLSCSPMPLPVPGRRAS